MEDFKAQVIETLREVYDPEIPVNIYDLGLIYDIKINDEKVDILMTLTSPTCPTADYIMATVKEAVENLGFAKQVNVTLTFDPPWTPDRVSMDAKEELGLAQDVSSSDIATQTVYSSDPKNSINENLCFKCQISDEIKPLLTVMYKGENKLICSKCLNTL